MKLDMAAMKQFMGMMPPAMPPASVPSPPSPRLPAAFFYDPANYTSGGTLTTVHTWSSLTTPFDLSDSGSYTFAISIKFNSASDPSEYGMRGFLNWDSTFPGGHPQYFREFRVDAAGCLQYGEFDSFWAAVTQQDVPAIPCQLYDGASHNVAVVNDNKHVTLFVDGLQVAGIVSGDLDGGAAAAADQLLYSPSKADLTPAPTTHRGGQYDDMIWSGTVSHLLISLTAFTAADVLQLHSQGGHYHH